MNVCLTVYIYAYSIAGYHGALGAPPSCPPPHYRVYREHRVQPPCGVPLRRAIGLHPGAVESLRRRPCPNTIDHTMFVQCLRG